MRDLTDSKAIDESMRALGRMSRRPARVYLTGGSSAVLFTWRETTIDIDLRFEPEHDELFRAMIRLFRRITTAME
jgi:hypothetical protein